MQVSLGALRCIEGHGRRQPDWPSVCLHVGGRGLAARACGGPRLPTLVRGWAIDGWQAIYTDTVTACMGSWPCDATAF